MRRLLLAVLALAAFAVPAAADPRIALVIGNSKYGGELPKLANPANDAELMAGTLKKLGFQVVKVQDADLTQMKRAISDFGTLLTNAGPTAVGLFYYAGHGIQVAGTNYLIPLKASITKAADADLEAVDAGLILKQMEFAGNALNIVILDACRNNPLSRGMRSASGGLARMDAPMGSFIAYSTAPGETAADGSGKNSPYTLALAKAMQKPGIPIEEAFRDARVDVIAATSKEQIPWESSSLTGAFSFNPAQRAAAAAPAPAPAGAAPQPAAATKTPPGPKAAMCKNCPEMVAIPAGTFLMGSPSSEDDREQNEGPQLKISVPAFSIGKYLVTRGQFAEFVEATGYKPAKLCYTELSGGKFGPSGSANWTDPGFSQTDEDPVVCVSPKDAEAYADWLARATGKAYRLPSESEWEYAARAGATTSRFWGDDADEACTYANAGDRAARKKYANWTVVDCNDGYAYTSPVGAFKPNKFGLYDMLGNVKQIAAGCVTDTLADIPTDGSASDSCGSYPLRGSSWESLPSVMRLADRQVQDKSEAGFHVGFRVAVGN